MSGRDCNRDQKDLKPAVLKLLLAAETEVGVWLTVRSFSRLKCPPRIAAPLNTSVVGITEPFTNERSVLNILQKRAGANDV